MLSHQVFKTGDVFKATAMNSGEILIQARRFEGSEDLGQDKRSAPTNQVSGPSPHNCPSSAFQMQIEGVDSGRRYLGAVSRIWEIWEISDTRWVAHSWVRRHASPQLTLSDRDPNKQRINCSTIQTKNTLLRGARWVLAEPGPNIRISETHIQNRS